MLDAELEIDDTPFLFSLSDAYSGVSAYICSIRELDKPDGKEDWAPEPFVQVWKFQEGQLFLPSQDRQHLLEGNASHFNKWLKVPVLLCS